MACARIAFLAISMAVLTSVIMATDHIVGDDKGWTMNFNYTKWTQEKKFRVGDRLVFNYKTGDHNVVKVDGSAFKNCDNSSSEKLWQSGNNTVELDFPGRKWYICGIKDHCAKHQMKLVVDVVDDSSAPAPNSAAHDVVSSIYGVLVAATVAITAILAWENFLGLY